MSKNKNKKINEKVLQNNANQAAMKRENQATAVATASTLTPKEKAKLEKAKRKEKSEKAKKEKKEKRGLVQSLRETGSELKKVRWPSLRTTMKQTGVVLSVVAIFAVVVFGLDRGLSFLYNLLTKNL